MKSKIPKAIDKEIPKVFDDPKLQRSYEEARKAARKAGLIGKITFA